MISQQLIHDCFEAASKYEAAIPVVSVRDSTREISEEKSRPLNRATLRSVQTPQCFDLEKIKNAYSQPFDPKFTDDASVYEAAGGKVHLVQNNRFPVENPGFIMAIFCKS